MAGNEISQSRSETEQPLSIYSRDSTRTTGGEFAPSSINHLPNDGGEAVESPNNSHVRRKPVARNIQEQPYAGYNFTPLKQSPPSRNDLITNPKIYWVTPSTGIGLFLLGLGAAIGHHFFLHSLNDTKVNDQVWINRLSLALAFVVKASLAAAVAIAYAQKLWYSLYRVPNGVSVNGIDALFTVLESPLQFGVWDMWRSAPIAAIMALVIWLLPLTALVSPTALTVGVLTNITTNTNCSVPTINMSNQPITTSSTTLALSTADHTGNAFLPSMVSQRLVGLTLRNGRQNDWSSPCGANCTYVVEFIAPSWKCNNTTDIDNPDAIWRHTDVWSSNTYDEWAGSYWFQGYGDGSNETALNASGTLEYLPMYAGGLNVNTSQFWVGVSGTIDPPGLMKPNQTIQQYLDLHVFYCDFVNSTYRVRVRYDNDHQSNDILSVTMLNRIHPLPSAWDRPSGSCQGDLHNLCTDRAQLDAISISRTLIETIQGTINRTPEGEVLSDNTTIALVPTLVQSYNITHSYGMTELAYPYKNIGPLLEELSHNISVSLISEPSLQVVGATKTTCITSRTYTVWKYKPIPLAVAYACAVGATLLALYVGGEAMLFSGVSRDKSFSSIVRTTRMRDLDELSPTPETACLPLANELGRIRLRFEELNADSSGEFGKSTSSRLGFRAIEKVESI